MTKVEKIKEAWIAEIGEEKWNEVSHLIDKEGYLDNSDEKHYLTFGDFKKEKSVDYCDNEIIRPKSLNSISNNNGWIKIESEYDLPKENCRYWVVNYGGQDTSEFTFDNCDAWNKAVWVAKISHYLPIVKPQPPLY